MSKILKAMNAKSFFREGYVMLLRPFQFAELDVPLQKLTIAYAYVVEPLYKEYLTEDAKERIEFVEERNRFNKVFDSDYLDREIESIIDSPSSYKKEQFGFKVQISINNIPIYLYPDEYNIISSERLTEILAEDGYHTICDAGLYTIKEYKDKYHYLLSRGVNKNIAKKWASIGFRDLVYYKPYYELLDCFCREHEIMPDPFYAEIEGIEI
jgi:hypothetical protein